MNTEWRNFFELLSIKICVLIFFCILCYKLWNAHGLPFFNAEYKSSIDAEQEREQSLTNLQQALIKKLEESRLFDTRLYQIKKTFTIWQEKIAKQLDEEHLATMHRLSLYTEHLKTKSEIIQHNEDLKTALKEVLSQTRTDLIKIYSAEPGAAALEISIAKIAAKTKTEMP